MKKSPFFLSAGLFAALSLTSCVSPYPGPNESVGGVLGAATGAVAGGIIGHQSGRGLEGAAIGGAIGALAGSAIGHSQDTYEYGHAPVAVAPVYVAPARPRRYYGRAAYVVGPRSYRYHRRGYRW